MKKALQFLFLLAISAVAIWYSFKQGGLTLGAVAAALGRVNYWWVIPFVLLTMLGMYLRAVRWHYLLSPKLKLSSFELFPALIIGFALNGLLPFRAGEFARAYALKKSHNCPFSLGLGTVFLERIFDSITMLGFIALMLWHLPPIAARETWGDVVIDAAKIRQLINGFAVVVGGFFVCALLLLSARVRHAMERLLLRLPLPEKPRAALIGMFHSFSSGMDSLKSARLIFWCTFWTFLVWAVVGISLQVMYYGFRSQVADFTPMTFPQGMMICMIICVAIMIPAAPGYWGLYEIGTILAFHIVNLSGEPDSPVPLSYALTIHFFQLLPIILVGIFYMTRLNLSFREILDFRQTAADRSEPRP